MKNQYLSDLTRVDVRDLFIERLLSNCIYVIYKKNAVKNIPQDCDYGHPECLDVIIPITKTENKIYSEIILAMTSPELILVSDILTELGYDNSPYLEFEKISKDYFIY